MEHTISTSDKIYADSLLKVSDDYAAVLDDIAEITKIIHSSKDLRELMDNPTVQIEKKFDIIESILKNSIDIKIINFLKVLISKNKFKDFDNICEAYMNAVEDINNFKSITIFSAVDLSDELKERIIQKLQDKYNKFIRPNWKIDKNIIGGLVIKSDDEVIDCSIKNKLNKISKI